MAKSSTTHVIEIESGIGEPAFIPLTLGSETQPISVGKKGMWRLESARVLDIHAFVYFDGTALFIQSVDDNNPAKVDARVIGTAWTELRAPCKIDVGAARLRYRSLLPESEEPVTAAIPVPAPAEIKETGPHLPRPTEQPRPPPPSAQSAPTLAADADEPTPVRDEETVAGAKHDRPFRPGAFSVSDADENTRFKPLETGTASPASRPAPPPPVQGVQAIAGGIPPTPTPAMAAPVQEHTYVPIGHAPMHAPSMPPNMPGSMPPMMQAPSMPPPAPTFGSGGYPAAPPGPPFAQQPTVPPGVMMPPPVSNDPFVRLYAQYKQWNPIKKAAMILLPIALVLGVVSLFDTEAPKPHTTSDAGVARANEPPIWPAGVPCPPPNWPADQPWPCRPNPATPATPATVATAAPVEAVPRDASVTLAAGGKSLQRQAVDAVAQGDLPRAASIYEELARREPTVTVYSESARILRAKLDAGP